MAVLRTRRFSTTRASAAVCTFERTSLFVFFLTGSTQPGADRTCSHFESRSVPSIRGLNCSDS